MSSAPAETSAAAPGSGSGSGPGPSPGAGERDAARLHGRGALMALMGLGVGLVNVQFGAWIQARVERALMGRVASVLMFCAVGLVPISYAAAGGLAVWSMPALFVGAGALLTVSSALAASSRAARGID